MMEQVDFSSKHYLLIDDFSAMLALMRGMLRSFGATRLDQAHDGEEAIKLMERTRYHVVICDYNLGPGKNGQQVLEEARHRNLIGVDAIFMMVTGETSREMVMSAMELAPDTYLTKPFTINMLKIRLAKLFERKANLAGVAQTLMAGNHDAAIAELNDLLALNPNNRADLLRLKADICLTTNRLEEAMTIYESVLEDLVLDWARLGKGKLLFERKQYAEARAIFTHLLESDPNFILAYDWLAKTQVAELSFDEAEQTLKKALQLSPRNHNRQQRLGDLALQNNDGQTAETAFERAVVLARHSVLNHPSLYAGLAKSKSINKKFDQALKVVGDIGKRFVDHLEAAIYEASTLAVIKQDRGDKCGALAALKTAEQSIAVLGGELSSRLSLEMVKTYSRLGETEKASALLEQAIANNHDDHEFLTEVVRICHETNLAQKADMAIRRIQEFIDRTNHAGVRLTKEGDYDAAIQLLHEAAEEMPGNRTFNLNAAKAWLIKMESRGASTEGIQMVRRYIARIKKAAPNDWRLADIQSRLQKLAIKV